MSGRRRGQRQRGFYSGGTPNPDDAQAMGASDSAEALMEAVRKRVEELLKERPQDVGLSLRSAQILLRSAIAERKLSGRADRELKGNVERVLQELGSQLLPADDPGEPGSE